MRGKMDNKTNLNITSHAEAGMAKFSFHLPRAERFQHTVDALAVPRQDALQQLRELFVVLNFRGESARFHLRCQQPREHIVPRC